MKHSLALALTGATALLIAYGTLTPPGSGGTPLPLSDKQIHFLAFALLTFPLGWTRPQWAWSLVLLATLYGAIIELLQPYVGRGAEWGDLLADGLGALSGVLPGTFFKRVKS